MGISRGLLAFVLTMVAAVPAPPSRAAPDESEPPAAAAWTVPGWQRESGPRGWGELAVLDRTFHGIGTITAPPLSALRVESTLVTGPAPVPTFLVAVLAGRIATDDMRAWGVRLPVFFGAPGEGPIASGNLFIERHALLTTPSAERPLWTSTWRIILPAATGDRWFLMVPGHDRLGGGGEGAAAMFRTLGDWRVHVELGAGVYFDGMMPLRSGITAAATRTVSGPFSVYGQVDPWVVLIPPPAARIDPDSRAVGPAWSGQLGMTVGGRLELSPLEAVLAVQRILGHANDVHIHLAVTWHR